MTKKYKDKAIEFEKKGLFDQDLNEHRYDNALRIDEGYSYLPRKISEKIRRFLLIPAVKFFGKIYAFFAYGFRIKGRKNLRKIRKSGAISVCNHVHEIDTLLVKLALGGYRTYHTGSFYLLKKGWAGRIFKAGGFLPVGGICARSRKPAKDGRRADEKEEDRQLLSRTRAVVPL